MITGVWAPAESAIRLTRKHCDPCLTRFWRVILVAFTDTNCFDTKAGIATLLPTISRQIMYLIAIAWMYVVAMMTIAEAASPNGTLLGAFFTFLLYGVLPLSIVLYILGTPGRKRRIKAQQEAERQAALLAPAATNPAQPASDSIAPDAGSESAAAAQSGRIAPVREES